MENRSEAAGRKKRNNSHMSRCVHKKRLVNTTSRDLSAALNLQNADIYYYFKSKDELVVACAEEAAYQLETNLIVPFKNGLDNPN